MSSVNGDKSRFHVKRKQKIARRNKTKELIVSLKAKPKASSSAKPKKASA